MDSFSRTRLNRVTGLREGSQPLGFKIEGAASDSGWYRLVPSNNDGEYDSDNGLRIASLRSDIDGLTLTGWRIWVSNDNDYEREEQVGSHSEDVFSGYSWLSLPNETGLRYILHPIFLSTPIIRFRGSGQLEVGFSKQRLIPGDTVEDADIKLLMSLGSGQDMGVPVASIQDMFYKFTSASASNVVYWGE